MGSAAAVCLGCAGSGCPRAAPAVFIGCGGAACLGDSWGDCLGCAGEASEGGAGAVFQGGVGAVSLRSGMGELIRIRFREILDGFGRFCSNLNMILAKAIRV